VERSRYSVDFGSTPSEILQWTLPYLAPEKAAALTEMLQQEKSTGEAITVEYSEYDWGLNSK
jgi:O-methyltransferase involved in polyketide biosynthesis